MSDANPPDTATPASNGFVIGRTFDAPLDLVWRAWTEPERIARWWGHTGSEATVVRQDLRPGGLQLYRLRGADGQDLWGRAVYSEIVPQTLLLFVNSSSDPDAGITRHPWGATWPLEMLSRITFVVADGQTTVTICWTPLDPTESERQAFDSSHAGMAQGWGGTLDQLTAYLETAAREIVSTRVVRATRETVWTAWTNPLHLARWWGPAGFTNTFHVFDLRPGGHWQFTMHGPDGANYRNESVFLEIERPARIVFDHVSPPRFQVTATFAEEDGGTRITFRMTFENRRERDALAAIIVPANEQNFDRIEAELPLVSTP